MTAINVIRPVLFVVLLMLMPFATNATEVNNNNHDNRCDPVVSLDAGSTTLQKALTQLANQHNFKLSFAVSVDKNIESPGEMPLRKMLHYLTKNINSMVQTEKLSGCEKGHIAELEIFPVGEDTTYVYVQQKPGSSRVKGNSKYTESFIIDDMNVYAEEVLLRKRKASIRKMSKEQRTLFRAARKAARARLKEQGLL